MNRALMYHVSLGRSAPDSAFLSSLYSKKMIGACLLSVGLSACGVGEVDEPLVVDGSASGVFDVEEAARTLNARSGLRSPAKLAAAQDSSAMDAQTTASTGVSTDGVEYTLASSNAVSEPAPVAGNSVNSIEAIVGDMTLENDAKLDGIPSFMWATGPNPAFVVMGSEPRGSKMLSWWQNMSAVRAEYKDSDLWTAYIQWFVVYEGVGNAGYNVRVETRLPKTYYLSKSTGKWVLLGEHAGTSWFLAAKSNLLYAGGTIDKQTNADGSVSIRVPVGSPYAHHGVWPLGKIDISRIVADVGALFTTVQARLVVSDPNLPDDRSNAILLMNSGADYYPDVNASANDSFPPGAGVSRAKLITSAWQSFNFATLNAARQDYVGASASISLDAFRMNPPPLE